MKKIPSYIIPLVLILIICIIPSVETIAQCPMCRMSAESNLANGGSAAKGLNNGILYIFAFPYVLVSILGFLWWRNNKKAKESQEGSTL